MNMEASERNMEFTRERRAAAKAFRKEQMRALREQAVGQREDMLSNAFPDIDMDKIPQVPRFIPGEIRPVTMAGQILVRSFGRLSVVSVRQVLESPEERDQRLMEIENMISGSREVDVEHSSYYNLHPERDAV